ncbi:MAG: GYD domain-containing protein [Planctomycetaceae bacterium]|nr:GYD domain-containing protein [Planctomycetaceae bacterium]
MDTYVILSKLSPDAFRDPQDLPALADEVKQRIKEDCPDVVWKDSYALMGRFDVVDLIEAPSRDDAEHAAMIIRAYGHATTETMSATPWKQFIGTLKSQRQTASARR